MPTLSQLQSDFMAYLVDDVAGASFKKQIVNDTKVGVDKRLSIYANAYRLRIIEALTSAYPKLKMLVGDDFFDEAARSYIEQFPSTYCNMRWVGGEMAAHLQHILPQHPVAAELAQFEWALGLAFDAADAPVKTLQDLAIIAPENWPNLIFGLHPSVKICDLQWNIVAIWNALTQENAPPPPTKTNLPCLIWRQDLNAHFQTISHQENKLIKLMALQATFGELCEAADNTRTSDVISDNGDAMQQVASYMASWLDAGLISHIQTAA